MTAYYNEHDPFAAAWLRNLIAAGHIAKGEVDERSIVDVRLDDLRGFTQHHFFAGIGVWSYALRRAGWPDDQPVWTGSCPCQPFSAAGKKGGFKDDRHLWPDWFRLIEESNPDTIFGEQVASKDGLAWFDLVSTDLERTNYTVGAIDTCAAGFGAPHIRQRLYFVGDSNNKRSQRRRIGRNSADQRVVGQTGVASQLANADGGDSGAERKQRSGEYGQQQEDRGVSSPVEHAESEQVGVPRCSREPRGATNGFWERAEWLPCIDGKARPVEPGTFPLAHGIANRVGLLRGYGNSLVVPQAQAFIEAFLEVGAV